jgi:hypothetical protein
MDANATTEQAMRQLTQTAVTLMMIAISQAQTPAASATPLKSRVMKYNPQEMGWPNERAVGEVCRDSNHILTLPNHGSQNLRLEVQGTTELWDEVPIYFPKELWRRKKCRRRPRIAVHFRSP